VYFSYICYSLGKYQGAKVPGSESSRQQKFHNRWQKYSGLVLCKSRGNSGVTAPTSRHWKLQESSMWRWFHIVGQCHTGLGVALPGCGGASVWGVGLAGYRFLCAGKYIAPLIEHEWGGSQQCTWLMRALRLRGSCSWLGKRKGSWMVSCLCSCPGCAVARHLEQ